MGEVKRQQCVVVQFDAVVAGTVVGHNLACVFVCSEVHAGNFVEAELLGRSRKSE